MICSLSTNIAAWNDTSTFMTLARDIMQGEENGRNSTHLENWLQCKVATNKVRVNAGAQEPKVRVQLGDPLR